MLLGSTQAAVESADRGIIQYEEPFYVEAPSLHGIWAAGETLEECRCNLAAALEDWVLLSVAQGRHIWPAGQGGSR